MTIADTTFENVATYNTNSDPLHPNLVSQKLDDDSENIFKAE